MSNTYQNVSNQNGRVKFVAVTNEGDEFELYTNTTTASVPVAGGARIPMVTQKLSLQTAKDVSCDEGQCVKSYVGNGVKIEFTGVRGDSESIGALITEAKRILDLWRTQYKADLGMSPPVHATFSGED